MPGEIYRVPLDVLQAVEAGEPEGLYRGPVRLEDGRTMSGILYPQALADERGVDITAYGGWRAYAERQ